MKRTFQNLAKSRKRDSGEERRRPRSKEEAAGRAKHEAVRAMLQAMLRDELSTMDRRGRSEEELGEAAMKDGINLEAPVKKVTA